MESIILENVMKGALGYEIHRGVEIDEVMALSLRDDVVFSTDGRYSIVQDGPMRSSLNASWHTDGLRLDIPPSVVLLYCENPGRGDITTDLAESAAAFNALSHEHQSVLRSIDRYYIARNSVDSHCKPLIQSHPITRELLISLSSRGWVKGAPDITLEQVTTSLYIFYSSLVPVVTHYWSAGDCLVINNVKYLHRRHSSQNRIDPDRRLIRTWYK